MDAVLTIALSVIVWFSLNFLSTFFQFEGLTIGKVANWAKRNSERHVACHFGSYTLYRLDGLRRLVRVHVSLYSDIKGFRYKLVPPLATEQSITGFVKLEAGHMVLENPNEVGSFGAIFSIEGAHAADFKIGVFSGTMINGRPYAGKAIMVRELYSLTDANALKLLTPAAIEVLDEAEIEKFYDNVRTRILLSAPNGKRLLTQELAQNDSTEDF